PYPTLFRSFQRRAPLGKLRAEAGRRQVPKGANRAVGRKYRQAMKPVGFRRPFWRHLLLAAAGVLVTAGAPRAAETPSGAAAAATAATTAAARGPVTNMPLPRFVS